MDKEQRRLLDNLAFRTGININKVHELLDDVGYDLTLAVLEATEAEDTYSKPLFFNRKAKEARQKAAGARKAARDTKAHERRVAAWEELHKKGFTGTAEELRLQVEDLYQQRLLHDYLPRTVPKGFDELDYEQQEGVLLGLAMKGIKELPKFGVPKPEPVTVSAVIGDIPF